MAHLFYEEEQKFSQVTWIWVMMLLLFIVPLVLMLMSEEQPNQKETVSILLSTAFAFIPVVGVLLFSKLQLKINEEGIHYKFFPSVLKWRVIPGNIIDSFEVSEKRSFIEKIECGYRRNRTCISMNVCGAKLARIKLKDGRRFKIGSLNPESMERALRKLTSPENNL